ncbi:hypothetical protein BDV59DRAFT_52833 [Aspergillus ambiguus]|uniref:uncharacterized protein n=1 Tax=Aspergillus ambiguus TaxID=176160 RepID=UPI003CCD1639
MSPKGPHAAFVEEYDEDAHAIVPDTRKVANVAARRSSIGEPLLDLASDSGYSSRTVNSSQSAPSGPPLKRDPAPKRGELARALRKDRPKDRSARPSRENDKMQVVYPTVNHHHHHHHPGQQSSSRRRDSAQMRHYPGTCSDCDQGLYHGTTPDPRSIDYAPYYMSQPSTPSIASSIHDYPPSSPQPARYAPSVIQQDLPVSRPSARSGRSNSYHPNGRPASIHGMLPNSMMYNNPGPPARYDRGPPLSSSAYANTYAPSQYSQLGPYYGLPEYIPHDYRKERSASRTRESTRARRPSMSGYGAPPPMLDYDLQSTSTYDDEESPLDLVAPPPPQPPQPQLRPRDEDYYRMPPPPLKHQPRIIQRRPDPPRKAVTTTAIPSDRRSSRSLDLAEFHDALPSEYGYQRSSRETIVPERNRSLRDSSRRRPSTSYHDDGTGGGSVGSGGRRPSRISVENSRSYRRRPTIYDYNEFPDSEGGNEIEEKQRDAEEYQAAQVAKDPMVALTADALCKTKTHRTESDSGSQKSRSSRGSDARTHSASGAVVKPDDNPNNFVMTMNGMTMSFTHDSLDGKTISVRSRDSGALSLNIHDKRPKKYHPGGGSDYSGSMPRRELEDVAHRARPERRSDRASRRSSRSTYSGR